MSRRAWTKPCCSVLSTPDRRGRCSGVRNSPPLHTTRGGGRRPAARDRATRTCARTITPHSTEASTFSWWPRAAVGSTDARSSRAASANPRHGRRSCSATAVLCGRLRFALASDPRYQRTTRCEPRHARTTLRASLHTPHHTTLAKRPAALAKRPISLAKRPTAPAKSPRAETREHSPQSHDEREEGVPPNRALEGWWHRSIHRSSHGPAQSRRRIHQTRHAVPGLPERPLLRPLHYHPRGDVGTRQDPHLPRDHLLIHSRFVGGPSSVLGTMRSGYCGPKPNDPTPGPGKAGGESC